MKRVTVAVLGVVLALTSACSGPGEPATEDKAETLSLYADGPLESPLARLELPVTELKDAQLISPHESISFTGWTVTRELTAEQLAAADVGVKALNPVDLLQTPDQAVRAPEGHELFIAEAADSGVLPLSRNDPMNNIEYALVVGGVSRPLGSSLYAHDMRDALLAVVPIGAEVRLTLTDEGRTQSLDLRTGRRIDAVAALYPVRETSVSSRSEWRYRGSIHTTVSAALSARLSPWTEGKGWAPAGRAWLTGTVSVWVASAEFRIPPKTVQTPAAVIVDLGTDLRLAGEGVPSSLFPVGTSVLAADMAFNRGVPEEASSEEFTVDVPETLRNFTVTLTPEIEQPGYARDGKPSDATSRAKLEAPGR